AVGAPARSRPAHAAAALEEGRAGRGDPPVSLRAGVGAEGVRALVRRVGAQARVSVHELLEHRRIVICGGAGGVGKTTTAAAIAMGMAARGLKVAVLTIDPAKRLANSLGLPELGNEERMV